MKLIYELPEGYIKAIISDLFYDDGDRLMIRYGISYSVQCGSAFSEIRKTDMNTNIKLLYSDVNAARVYIPKTEINEHC